MSPATASDTRAERSTRWRDDATLVPARRARTAPIAWATAAATTSPVLTATTTEVGSPAPAGPAPRAARSSGAAAIARRKPVMSQPEAGCRTGSSATRSCRRASSCRSALTVRSKRRSRSTKRRAVSASMRGSAASSSARITAAGGSTGVSGIVRARSDAAAAASVVDAVMQPRRGCRARARRGAVP